MTVSARGRDGPARRDQSVETEGEGSRGNKRDSECGFNFLREGTRPSLPRLVQFIDQSKANGHRVESTGRVLRQQGVALAGRSYRAWKQRVPSARTIDDAILTARQLHLAARQASSITVVLQPAAEKRSRPPPLDHPRGVAHCDRDLDRADPPPPPAPTRPFDPDRIRGHHEHVSRIGCVTRNCHLSVQQTRSCGPGSCGHRLCP